MAGYSRCSSVKTVGVAGLLLLVITFIGHRFHSKLEKVTSFSYSSSKCAARNGNTLFMSNITSYKLNIGKTKLNSVLYQPLASYVNATDLTANGFEIKRTNVKCIGYMSAIITSTSSFYIGNRGTYMESASFSSDLESCPLEPPNLGKSQYYIKRAIYYLSCTYSYLCKILDVGSLEANFKTIGNLTNFVSLL